MLEEDMQAVEVFVFDRRVLKTTVRRKTVSGDEEKIASSLHSTTNLASRRWQKMVGDDGQGML